MTRPEPSSSAVAVVCVFVELQVQFVALDAFQRDGSFELATSAEMQGLVPIIVEGLTCMVRVMVFLVATADSDSDLQALTNAVESIGSINSVQGLLDRRLEGQVPGRLHQAQADCGQHRADGQH